MIPKKFTLEVSRLDNVYHAIAGARGVKIRGHGYHSLLKPAILKAVDDFETQYTVMIKKNHL